MPTKTAKKEATKKKKRGNAPSTQASGFVKAEMHKRKKKKMSRKQAVAIGLSEARHSGIKVGKKKKKASRKKTSKKTARRSKK